MKRNVRRALSALLSVVMLLSLLVVPAGAAGETAGHTIWVVGDSTVCHYGDNEDQGFYYKRMGYGDKIGEYVTSDYTVKNLGASGRSSKSFPNEGANGSKANYDEMIAGMKAGDLLIIGFGHNDEKTDAERFTDPKGDYQTEGSFAKSLYDNYVKPAKDKGAIPVLCTPIVRHHGIGKDWGNSSLHVANGGSYPEAVIKLGQDTNTAVVDLTTLTKELYETLDTAEANSSTKLHSWSQDKADSMDSTHINKYGAKWVAYTLAKDIVNSTDANVSAELKAAFTLTAGEPTADDLAAAATPGWTPPEYAAPKLPEEKSTIWENYVAGDCTFYGTAFGSLGGNPTTDNYTMGTDAQGNMQFTIKKQKGKVASTEEGFLMYFVPVPAGKNFTLKATATFDGFVAGATNPNQAAFGLMARDAIWIDKNDKALKSDYVVAGTFGDGGANCFRRKSDKLEKPTSMSMTPTVGTSYDLTLQGTNDGYTCIFDDQPAQSGGYDFKLTTMDADYVYVGMFVSRSMSVTFSEIYLEVDGEVLCNTTPPFAFSVADWNFTKADGSASDEAVDGGKLASITGDRAGREPEAMALVAVYDLNGKMTGVKIVVPKNGELPVGLKMNGGETAKVIVLNKTTLVPYGEASSVTSGTPGGGDTPGPEPSPSPSPSPSPAPDGKRIQVWDFGGKVESNTDLYTNNITPETLLNAKMEDGNPTILAGVIKTPQNTTNGTEFGNVVFAAGNNDKFFSNITELATLAGSNAGNTHSHAFDDGYTSAGGFITNGGGNTSRRNVTVKKVKAGETVTAYLSNNQSDTTFEVEGYPDIPKVTVPSKAFGVMSFVAPADGAYKIWANGGKPGYLRVTVTPPVTVSGAVTLPDTGFDATGWGVSFVNSDTQAITEATVTGNNYTAELAPGKYIAALTGAPGWGVDRTVQSVTVDKANLVDGQTHALTVVERAQYTYSGTITGFAADYDLTDLAVTMVADVTKAPGSLDVPLELVKTDPTAVTFTALLDAGVEYAVDLAGADDYSVKTPAAPVTSAGDNLTGQTITVEAKALTNVSGKLVVLDPDDQFAPLYADSTYEALPDGKLTALKFAYVEEPVADLSKEIASEKYVYDATLTSDGGYTASLRPGAYKAVATVDGYTTTTHVVVKDAAVEKDLLFVAATTPTATYAADLYVGYASDETKTPNFKTVTGALAYIKSMGERTDAQRVTVHIAPGVYREQINVDVKNVTFVNDDPSKEAKLTWYYGIGYKYYSAKYVSGTEDWYDPERAFDRYEKADYDVARWGATVRVRAPGFQAENITFENSFNYYVTDEEVYDGVAYNGKETIRFARDPGADVTSKAATERAAAIWVDTNTGRGDMTEFKNCKFLSSQDTVGTGKRMYFKDCYIEGMTDYICGPGDCVFDTCTLNWKGYSEVEKGGYVTAPKTDAAEKGYLFRNCYISGDTKLMLVGGSLGRTWGAENTKCLYLNTTLQSADMIVEPSWTAMQGFDPATGNPSKLLEWGTKLLDGTPVDLSKRQLQNTVLKTAPTVDVKATYFGGWTPTYYVEEAATVAIDGNVSIVDNGDLNLPYPGHTLTAVYSLGEANNANDASVIQWYRVKDGTETLVKSSVANADRTYKIDKADIGAQIKVTVTPTTLSGKTGEAKSATIENTVLDGYDDPSGETDPVLGDGVNIFLAGDSTVKHYGATGMHQSGKIGKEGSWGEYLQAYFNDKVTVANYANGGRSTRNFVNEGKLDAIADKIGEGDYLFIQFGHNDCADGETYIEDRYVPLGTPDGDGKYPTTAGTKSATPDSLKSKYGAEWYAWDCGGTYKWFLQQYIDVAKNAGATPVLITPVSRMYYSAAGAITPHHDADRDNTNNNAYCEAVKQLAQEQNVLLIDGFELTKTLYEDAWKADTGAADSANSNIKPYGKQVMAEGDKTHSNKLGGMIEAALIAQAVQGLDLNISKAVQAPGALTGKTHTDATAFTVNSQGTFTAYDMLNGYAQTADYWTGVGQSLIDAIATKAAELNTPVTPAP